MTLPEVLQFDDVCKLDFGVQVGASIEMQSLPQKSVICATGGRIVDCAFTIAFNERPERMGKKLEFGPVRSFGFDELAACGTMTLFNLRSPCWL